MSQSVDSPCLGDNLSHRTPLGEQRMAPTRLDSAEESKLFRRFPALPDVLSVEHPSQYEYRAISIFDDWLGKDNLHKLDTATKADYDARSEPLKRFSELLLRDTEALGIAVGEPLDVSAPSIFAFSSPEEAQRYARPSTWDAESTNFFRLLLPELKAIYLESWDFTNALFLLNLSCLPRIHEVAANAGVFVLEKNW
jgi:hypothetical protein